MHLNIIQGDYIFYEWKDNAYQELEAKQEELKAAGYILQTETDDYLNTYFNYVNPEGEQKTITMCNV